MTQEADNNEEINEAVFFIAGHLNETSKQALGGIYRIINTLGVEQAQTFMREARTIHNAGGQTKKDGSLRTLGGVFFRLVRDKVTPKQRARIWPQKPRPRTKETAG